MILAGHRYGKSAQKRHAARAYQQALQVLSITSKLSISKDSLNPYPYPYFPYLFIVIHFISSVRNPLAHFFLMIFLVI